MSKALCIFPFDKSTQFLAKTIQVLGNRLGNDFQSIVIRPNQQSHLDCLDKISKGPEDLIIFFGHGQSDKLFGATEFRNGPLSHSNIVYSNDNFITRENLHVFRDKKVFCLSCNSNVKLGKWSIESGAKTFLGFGDIPTDWLLEYRKRGISIFDVYAFRNIVRDTISQSLSYAILNNLTFSQLEKNIKIVVNKKIYTNVYKYRVRKIEWVKETLYRFKDEIQISGNRELNLLG